MATRLLSKEFEDIFGNVTTFYRSNVGDKIISRFTIENAIQARSSDTNYFTVNNSDNTITLLSGNWEDYGFRVGQTVAINSPLIAFVGTTIDFMYDNVLGFPSGALASIPNQSYNTIDYLDIASTTHHDCCDIYLNFNANGAGNSTGSLIDGENSILRFTNLDALGISGSVSGVRVGLKSGQFDFSGTITYVSTVGYIRRYEVELTTIQSGIYTPAIFAGAGSLKELFQFTFQVVEGEPYGNSFCYYNNDADSGNLNEAFNTGIVNSVLLDSFTSLDYSAVSNKQFTIDTPTSEKYVSALYVPLDDEYYKNNNYTQDELTMMLDSHVPYSDTSYGSFTNPLGASYTMEFNTISTSGTQTTYEIIMTPNTDFADFMDGRDEGDRRFVVYFRAGDVNLVLFDGQLTKQPTPSGLINVFTSTLITHDANTTNVNFVHTPVQYTESNMALVTKFRLPKNTTYDRFVSIIEAYDSVTGDTFELEKVVFGFENVQISNDGVYLLNESIGRNNNLPSNSAKKTALLTRYPSLDNVGFYGVKLYYPYINRWEYWIDKPNVDVSFYPNQNENWQPYSASANWDIRIRSYIESDDLSWEHTKIITINDFDSGNFTTDIELFRENGSPVSAVIVGEVMTIKATHTATVPINISESWVLIKVERFENQPAWWASSVLGNGDDTNNPLSDVVMTTVGNQLILECKFDTTKINTTGGVSISSEAFGSDDFGFWLTTDGDFYVESGTLDKFKIIE